MLSSLIDVIVMVDEYRTKEASIEASEADKRILSVVLTQVCMIMVVFTL